MWGSCVTRLLLVVWPAGPAGGTDDMKRHLRLSGEGGNYEVVVGRECVHCSSCHGILGEVTGDFVRTTVYGGVNIQLLAQCEIQEK